MAISEIYNENLNAVSQSSSSLNSYINNLNEFRTRVLGVNSAQELVTEIQKIELSSEDYKNIMGLINDEYLKNNIEQLKNAIDNYLNEMIDVASKQNKTAEADLDVQQQKIAEDIVDTLNGAGVSVAGGVDSVKDKLSSGELSGQDIEKIYENAQTVADNYNDKDNNTVEAELTADEIVETKTGEQLVDQAEASQEVVSDMPSTVTIDNNGNVLMNGQNDFLSINFTAMMMLVLVTSGYNNGVDLGLNFDAKISKELNQKNTFDVAFGDFKTNINKFNTDTINMFNEQVKSFDANTDYLKILKEKSPELAMSLELLQNNVLGQEGLFKMAIKNSGENKNILIRVDENYQELADCFRQNCDDKEFGSDLNGNSVITMGSDAPFVLMNTVESLNANKKMKEQASNSLKNTYQKIKDFNKEGTIVNSDAAKVNTTFLTVVAVAEVILVGIFIAIIL